MSEFMAGAETPLHYFHGRQSGENQPAVLVREALPRTHLNLRGNPDDPEFCGGVESVSGLPLPRLPCTFAGSGESGLYWLGPDEWLLIAAAPGAELETLLREALSGHVSIVDVSGGQTLLNLSGEGLPQLLMKSCHYDFHPANFGPGRCVQTNFARAGALAAGLEDGSVDLVIRRSYSDYLARWLLDAGAESGVRLDRAPD
jgi:sarcosine oxidase subunit gamma